MDSSPFCVKDYMKKNVYEIAIVFNPKNESSGEGAHILVIDNLLASSLENARTLASREIPEEYVDRLDEVTVSVRPF